MGSWCAYALVVAGTRTLGLEDGHTDMAHGETPMLKELVEKTFDCNGGMEDVTIGFTLYGSNDKPVKELVAGMAGQQYNSFDGTKLGGILTRIVKRTNKDESLAIMGGIRRIEFGLECSHVLYIHLNPIMVREQPDMAQELAKAICMALKKAEPDELDIRPGCIIRAWWD